jgi:putative NADH-flavin reductase
MNISNTALKIIQGDVLQPGDVEAAVKDHDAVICCIGAPANKASDLRSAGTRNIVRAMNRSEVKRFICQASLGYADSKELLNNTGFVFKSIIVPLLLKKTFADHELQESVVRSSSLNWTIVRPGSLTNGKYTGQYKQGFSYSDRSVKVRISRADTADCILGQLQENNEGRNTIGVSY